MQSVYFTTPANWASIKEVVMKEKKKEYIRRIRKHFEKNIFKGKNTCVVALVRYTGWTSRRKLMTTHKGLHRSDDIERLYLSRKERESGLASIKDSMDASIQWFEDDTRKTKWLIFTATRNCTETIRINRTTITRKQKWEENNWMDTLTEKQAKSRTRRPGQS